MPSIRGREEECELAAALRRTENALHRQEKSRLFAFDQAEQTRRQYQQELSNALQEAEAQAHVLKKLKVAAALLREEESGKMEEQRFEVARSRAAQGWEQRQRDLVKALRFAAAAMQREQEGWEENMRYLEAQTRQAHQRREQVEFLRRAKKAMEEEDQLAQRRMRAEEEKRRRARENTRKEQWQKTERERRKKEEARQRQDQERRQRAREGAREEAEREEEQKAQDDAKQRQEEKKKRSSKERQREEVARRQAEAGKAREEAEAEERRRTLLAAWSNYQRRWQTLASVPSLTFSSVPWPVVPKINVPESLVPRLIADFILSPEHSPTKSHKRRIHLSLLRWHPDHFDANFLHKVVEQDLKAVEEGVGRVVRYLNDLLARDRE